MDMICCRSQVILYLHSWRLRKKPKNSWYSSQ